LGRSIVLVTAALGAAALTMPTAAGVGRPAPEITAETWLNAPPQRLADLHGRVVLVEFWTFGCYNCRNVEPHVIEWYRKYAQQGLVVIGVHTPETAYERDVENVKRYVREHALPYPVAIDTDSTVWSRYDNHAWPAWFLIDKQGTIRHVHVGEGGYAETEREIEALLRAE
jgi:thiol-disulfide isomerase/thioredoxin